MTALPQAGWDERTVADASVILDNLRVPLSAAQRARRAGPYPYCGANGVLDHINDFRIDDDVVLLAEDGGNFDDWARRPIAYRMNGKIWVNNHAHVLKASETNDTGFLFYALEHKDISPFISSGTRSKLTRGELVRIKLLMPQRVEEQRTIAGALSAADGLIATLTRLIAKKEAIKQGIMQQLLTGRTRLPGFVDTWRQVTVGEIVDHHRVPVDPRRYPKEWFQHFSLPAFDDGEKAVWEQGLAIGSIKFRVPVGAVLVSKLNPRIPRVWAPASVSDKAVSSTEYIVMTPKGGIDRSFLQWMMKSAAMTTRMELLATGTTGSHHRISAGQVRSMKLRVPRIEEQAAIAQRLDDADDELVALRARVAKASAIKRGMMQQLLTGRTRLPVRGPRGE